MSSGQVWSCAERKGMLYKTPLRSYLGCCQTHWTQEPLHICSASVAGSVCVPTDFCRCNLTRPCFQDGCHLPSWGFPVDADLLSACVEATRKWGVIVPRRKPLSNGKWEPVDKIFPLPLLGQPVLRCSHSCGLLEDSLGRWSNQSRLTPRGSQLHNAPLYLLSFLPCLAFFSFDIWRTKEEGRSRKADGEGGREIEGKPGESNAMETLQRR